MLLNIEMKGPWNPDILAKYDVHQACSIVKSAIEKYKIGHKGFRDRQNDGKRMATQSVDRNTVMVLTQLVTGPTMRRI